MHPPAYAPTRLGETEDELQARSLKVFRKFVRPNSPNELLSIGDLGRFPRDARIAAERALIGPFRIAEIELRFIGLWDTVAA